MPVILTVAFSGALSSLVNLPMFPATKSIDWFIPMTTTMGGAFAGVTTGLGVARDFESGFYDRFLLSPIPRTSLIAGGALAAAMRSLIPISLMLLVANIGQANFKGGAFTVVPLIAAAMGFSVVASLWSMAIALKFRTVQAAPLMTTAVFLSVFLSTAQMPLHLLSGWIHTVAKFNPVTKILALARQGFLGEVTWEGSWPGLLALTGLLSLTLLLASLAMMGLSRR